MTNKTYKVTMIMPDLVAAHAEQEARVDSSHWAVALRLACDEISKRTHVRGKHIRSARIVFTVLEGSAIESGSPDQADFPASSGVQGSLFDV